MTRANTISVAQQRRESAPSRASRTRVSTSAEWHREAVGIFALVATTVLVTACASRSRTAPPPATTRTTEEATTISDGAEPHAAPRESSPAPVVAPAPAPATQSEAPGAAAGAAPSSDMALDSARKEAPSARDPQGVSRARVRLSEARRDFEIAANERDCARLCRALDSMDRATRQICELARSSDERRECASAEDQVNKAHAKVHSACGSCPSRPQ